MFLIHIGRDPIIDSRLIAARVRGEKAQTRLEKENLTIQQTKNNKSNSCVYVYIFLFMNPIQTTYIYVKIQSRGTLIQVLLLDIIITESG